MSSAHGPGCGATAAVFLSVAMATLASGQRPPSSEVVQHRPTGGVWATRSEVFGRHGMAATSHPLATQVAIDVLRDGGTAVDAAIAANAILCLCEPTGCGIGGDLFAIVWDQETRRLFGLNGSGRSPRGLRLEHFAERGLERVPARGALSVSVPGCVDAWCTLHERFGRLPLRDVLGPAIEHALAGVPVPAVIAHYWALNATALSGFEDFAAVFLPGGRAPRKGEPFHNPALSATLDKIASGGRDAFYEGDVAKTIAAHVRNAGGFLSADDLASHRSDWVEPISTTYRGHRVYELPPNGQGIAALQMLGILEAYDIAALGFGSAEYVHLLVEAKKLVFEDRARWYGDPEFATIEPQRLVERLLSPEYTAQRRSRIDRERAAASPPAGTIDEGDTIYLTVADRSGDMVSLIQSNYRGMGSGLTPTGLGFVLQNRGELFDLTPGRPNSYAPGKRPFHTIIPAFVTKGDEPWLSFGVMGGAMQPQGHVQILVNLIDFGMDLQEAGDAPRVRHDGSSEPTGERMTDGGTVVLEPGFAPELRARLAALGHRVAVEVDGFGGYQAIRRDADSGVYTGASESRKDGHAAGW